MTGTSGPTASRAAGNNTVRRLLLLCTALGIAAAGLTIRAVDDGALGQHTGTALYGGLVYVGVLLARPPLRPVWTGPVSLALCCIVEAAQLTPYPAALATQSGLFRLVLGQRFDMHDLAWYTAGVALGGVVHWLARAK